MLCPGQPGTAIDRKMAITSTVNAVYARLIGEYAFFPSAWKSLKFVDPTQQKNLDQVFFGATVTYAHERGTERTITIVGVDEADLNHQQVSWISPIARALMKAREGDIVELQTPAGIERVEVLAIRYSGSDGSQQH